MCKFSKRIFLFFCCILSILCYHFWEYKRIVEVDNFEMKENSNKTKVILLWNSWFASPDYNFGLNVNSFKEYNCPVTNCVLTKNRLHMPQHEFDAILFHGYEFYEIFQGKPYYRNVEQYYVFMSLEAPARTYIPATLKHFYNMSMTYRLDSDIPWPYFRIRNVNRTIVAPKRNMKWPNYGKDVTANNFITNLLRRKTKKVAWFVSNCRSTNGRSEYVKELQQYIEVDIYGKCGNLKCTVTHDKECKLLLQNDYYFYLAFENSHCVDYVTEKVITAMTNSVVPVVYGKANYSNFLPPQSYIDANELTPKELATKLNYLITNFSDYASYFWWRKHYTYEDTYIYSIRDGHHPFCKLCAILNVSSRERTSHYEVRDWWLGDLNHRVCLNPRA